ncbi:MAG: hypothetical protein RLW61_18800 [Gammaproteobacteria bacterium]
MQHIPGIRGMLMVALAVAASCAMDLAFAAVSTNVRSGFQSQRFDSVDGTGSAFVQSASLQHTASGIFGEASASAGPGSLSTFATAAANANSSDGSNGVYMTARATLNDSFTITSGSELPLLLEFAAGASGTVEASHPGGPFGISTAETLWSIALSGPGADFSTSGGITKQWNRRAPTFVFQLDTVERGIGFDDFVIAIGVPAGSAGQTFDIAMSATAHASVSRPQSGNSTAIADFGSTLEWLGLVSATLPDGTPYTGPLTIVSESGFDYREAATPVPLPATALLLALGCLPWIARPPRRA